LPTQRGRDMNEMKLGVKNMQMQIVVDDELISEALRVTGIENEEVLVQTALRELIDHRRGDALANAFGRFPWDGDLDAMRTDQ
jgi:Arc/MetJ family transcription regulator